MKKILLLTIFSLLLLSCGGNNNDSTDAIIKSGDLTKMKERRALLQTEITNLDAAIAAKDTVQLQALVSTTAVKDTTFTHYLEVQGNVETDQNIIIYPQFSGVLTTLNVKAGQSVGKGQVLGRIDDGGLSQQVAQLEAQLALSRTTFERQKRLWDQKIGSEIQFLQAQTDMQSRQKALGQIRAQLAKTVVTAPFSGVIDEIITDRGQVVNPQQGLMRIVNLSNMYITTSVPEAYIGKVKVGTPVQIELTSLGKSYTGKVRQVASNINPANRSFTVEVSVPNTENLLRPNQVAKLKIADYTNANSIVVPANVIQEDAADNKYVYIVENVTGNAGTAKKVVVKTGQTASNYTEILSGLKAGDIIVTDGVSNISEGTKLNF
ncbi:MAG TPA: efflux RND transporter periplasmic adaptor subunit [Flavobacterium sp.]|jgi:RND family efflux transporter MFP subunit|nr:efflux RND transporter periplasmic adaptor subunit [Flavobacterium sp.]